MTVAPAVSSTRLPAGLASYVEAERRRADVAGIAVAAFDRDGIRFAGGSGYADLARGERVTPDTLFWAASISKLFTTTLVLQEVEAGRIGLDDPVNRYLDARTRVLDSRGRPTDVTVRHLLTHTSGLPVSWRGLEQGNVVYRRLANEGPPPRTLADVVAGMRTVRSAGKRIVYSNGGFALLGYLVARLDGRPFPEVVRERVLEPLGMERSSFPVELSGPGTATPYGRLIKGGAGRRPAGELKNWSGPAGGLVTSALELARFGRMALRGGELDGNRILAKETLEEATRVHALNHPELDEGLGLGFFASRWRGRVLVGHDGGLAGVATRVAMLPQDGVGVVVLTNGGDAAFAHRVAERILEMLAGLEPEEVPGSPAGIPEGREAEWKAFTQRVMGRYRMVDMLPHGPLGVVLGAMARPRLSDLADGCLVMDGAGFEPAVLYPDGEVGRYRVAFPLANGCRAVIEERAGGTDFWASILHLRRGR